MIRHILLVRCNHTATPDKLEEIRMALAGLDCPGRTNFSMGPDLGLRPGNMDLAMVADFDDEQAFAAYNDDPEHDRIRKELIIPVSERFERCQYQI
jgi:hypothetical protein